MGTEINYFYIENSILHQRGFRKATRVPIDWYELYNGRDSYLEIFNTDENFRPYHQVYGAALYDADLNLLLFYIKFCELGNDSILLAGNLLKKIDDKWEGVSVKWAFGGDVELRRYIESRTQRKNNVISDWYFASQSSPTSYAFLDLDVPTTAAEQKTDIELERMQNILLEEIEDVKQKYPNEPDIWEGVIHYNLTQTLFELRTSLLYIPKSGKWKHYHFDLDANLLLSLPTLDDYCEKNVSIIDDSIYIPDSLKWCLSNMHTSAAIVIDTIENKLTLFCIPDMFFKTLKLLQSGKWKNYDVFFDLASLIEYRDTGLLLSSNP
ncbi:MAG: hypothetical protein KDE51_18955 [Anaerolineales bacterium]|nr:hypothetical protein [Anaerolineales bacterium]